MLGFFANMRDWDEDREVDDDDYESYDYVARFVRATRFYPCRGERRDFRALDARHGRSGRVRKENYGDGFNYGVVPYTSFYTPGIALLGP
nr:unnamed protein product [Digitaria exilis]